MEIVSLNGVWQGKCFTEDGRMDFCFEGKVPGCVHSDLCGSVLPKDLYYRDNAELCEWVENRDFSYERSFTLSSIPHAAKLVFEGLDVYADIDLNGKRIGSVDNMFISHSFDVQKILREGENRLKVYFHSPIKAVRDLPLCRGAFTQERMRTRRIQCTYGWDWVARFVTCGIWRDVYLDCREGFGVKDAYIYTDHIGEKYASIVVETEFCGFEQGGHAEFEIWSPCGERVYFHRFFVQEPSLKTYIDLQDPMLWYPAGYGEQPIYTLCVCGKQYPFGIRTAKILELSDDVGSEYYSKCLEIKESVSGKKYDANEEFAGFQLLVNDVPIFCQGANWVPSEPFVSEESDEKITTLLTLAKQAGLNMLRVWGGGIFEKQHFYVECDRLGILLTQDFLMACGCYPETEESFLEQIRKEAEFAARKLRNHPSLVWWSGDNENAVKGFDDSEDYCGRTVIYKAIYPVLNRLDPHRRFFLSSPYGGTPYASKTKGTTHNTSFLGCSIFPYILKEDMQDYKEHFGQYLARFIAEEPTLGAISLPSLKRFMTEEDIFEKDEMWDYHTKGSPDLSFSMLDILHHFAQKVLGEYKDGQDRFFKMKYAQYEWIRITMENMRRNRGFVNGILYWMWNDCWPAATGWSMVDYYGLPKASYYSFKRCAKKIVLSIDRRDEYDVYLDNNSEENKTLTLTVSCVLHDVVTRLAKVNVAMDAYTTEKVYSIPCTAVPKGAMLICDVVGENAFDRAFYKGGKLIIVPCRALRVLERTPQSITVCADAYIHAVELEGELVFEDNYFSLMPGERRTIFFTPAVHAQTDDLIVNAYTVE